MIQVRYLVFVENVPIDSIFHLVLDTLAFHPHKLPPLHQVSVQLVAQIAHESYNHDHKLRPYHSILLGVVFAQYPITLTALYMIHLDDT